MLETGASTSDALASLGDDIANAVRQHRQTTVVQGLQMLQELFRSALRQWSNMQRAIAHLRTIPPRLPGSSDQSSSFLNLAAAYWPALEAAVRLNHPEALNSASDALAASASDAWRVRHLPAFRALLQLPSRATYLQIGIPSRSATDVPLNWFPGLLRHIWRSSVGVDLDTADAHEIQFFSDAVLREFIGIGRVAVDYDDAEMLAAWAGSYGRVFQLLRASERDLTPVDLEARRQGGTIALVAWLLLSVEDGWGKATPETAARLLSSLVSTSDSRSTWRVLLEPATGDLSVALGWQSWELSPRASGAESSLSFSVMFDAAALICVAADTGYFPSRDDRVPVPEGVRIAAQRLLRASWDLPELAFAVVEPSRLRSLQTRLLALVNGR